MEFLLKHIKAKFSVHGPYIFSSPLSMFDGRVEWMKLHSVLHKRTQVPLRLGTRLVVVLWLASRHARNSCTTPRFNAIKLLVHPTPAGG